MNDAPPNKDNVASGRCEVNSSNRHGLDYREEARTLGPPPCPIIDVHAHLSGEKASELYAETADLLGVQEVWTMTQLENAPRVRGCSGRSSSLYSRSQLARSRPPLQPMGLISSTGFSVFMTKLGARMIKLFAAPKLRDVELDIKHPDLFQLDSPLRRKNVALAERLGMMVMTHIADPDTWFQAKYNDPERYGTKRSQYDSLERMLDSYDVQWIAAHMGGSPEDLPFLDGLLERHDNLHLDTSACKWMLRTLGSKNDTKTSRRSSSKVARPRVLWIRHSHNG